MAILKNDELNIIQYFSEMDLPEEEIDNRVSLAFSLREVISRVFVLYKAMSKVGDIDGDYLKQQLKQAYMDVLEREFDMVDEYHEDFVLTTTESVIDTTIKNGDTSDKRIKTIAVNDANVFCNNMYEDRQKAKGFTRKRWETMLDSRVRHSHMMVDGEERLIDETFDVGVAKMRFPMDVKFGAPPEEILGCRCVCKYFR